VACGNSTSFRKKYGYQNPIILQGITILVTGRDSAALGWSFKVERDGYDTGGFIRNIENN